MPREEASRMSATVFLVDDDPKTVRRTAHQLAVAGLRVETFPSSADFLAAFEPERSGCVVCGIRVPPTGGIDLLRRLRALGSEIPVVFVTGGGDVRTAVHAIKAGAIDILETPIDPTVLVDHVRRALDEDAAGRVAGREKHELVRRYRSLSARERLVMAFVIQGLPTREIAERLAGKAKTLEAQRASMMKKMGAENVAHLVRMSVALQEAIGSLDPPDPAGSAPPDPG